MSFVRKMRLLCGLLPVLSLAVIAAGVDSPGPPGDAASHMPTLLEICNRLDTGSEPPGPSGSFSEPTNGPGVTPVCTLLEVLAKSPTPDPTNGADDADVLAGRNYWALIPGAGWGTRTGQRLALRVQATGQTGCWDNSGNAVNCAGSGQDGEYQAGAAVGVTQPLCRYVANGDGTVTDYLTGLTWLQDASCLGLGDFQTALSAANGLSNGSCGLTDGSLPGDWRLPNLNELRTLVDSAQVSPALPACHPYTNVQLFSYWTSTSFTAGPNRAWAVSLNNASSNFLFKTLSFYTWAVRGGL